MIPDDRAPENRARDDKANPEQANPEQANPEQRGEIVQSTVPEAHPEVIDVPETDPRNETPTDRAAKLQQEMTGGIIPDNEDG